MKKEYLKPVFTLLAFDADIITTSGPDNEVDFSWDVDELKSFYD